MSERRNLFGAELPPEAIKAKQQHPERGHEAARDAMVEGLVQRTRALVPLVQFTETITEKNTTAEIFDRLERMQKQVLASVSAENKRKVPVLVKQWKRSQILVKKLEERYPDKPDEWVLFDDEEFNELADLDIRLLRHVGGKEQMLVLATLLFVDGLKKRRHEVEQITDEAMALRLLNRLLKKKGYGQLQKNDISEVYFRPFDIGFSVSTGKLKALLSRDVGGTYFSSSPFFLVRAKIEQDDALDFLFQRPKDASVRHESTHASLDTLDSKHFDASYFATPEIISHTVSFDWHDPSLVFEARLHGYQRLTEKWQSAASEDERLRLSKKRDESKRILLDPTLYLDASRNEFLAELSALYRAPADPLSWSTADKHRKNFSALLKEKASADPSLPFDAFRESYEKRSEVARKSLVMALRIARGLGSDAQAFVASATLLLQPSQYHHLGLMLEQAYGKERVGDLRLAGEATSLVEEPFEKLDEVVQKRIAPLSAERQKQIREAARLDERIDTDVLAFWDISSGETLRATIERMRKWPQAFLGDDQDAIRKLVRQFCFLMTDALLAGNVVAETHMRDSKGLQRKLTLLPTDLQDPLLRELFLAESKSGLLDSDGAADLMGLASSNKLTRKKVMKTRLATFAREAGIESEFVALVQEVVPEKIPKN